MNKTSLFVSLMNDQNIKMTYPSVIKSIQNQFDQVINNENRPIFLTTVTNLFDLFLDSLPNTVRQHFNCNTCKNFINNYGNLVAINNDGTLTSVLWNPDNVPYIWRDVISPLNNKVISSSVIGIFLTDMKMLGIPKTNEWDHFHIKVKNTINSKLKTPQQLMAEKHEEYNILNRSIYEFPLDITKDAEDIFQSDILYRSEKFLGIIKWFRNIQELYFRTNNINYKNHLLWLSVATAPVGFCNIRSSMIGTVLEDLVSGLSISLVKERFDKKMKNYQRPTSAPTIGNVNRAEEIFKKLNIEKSLCRRYATIDEVEKIWSPSSDSISENHKVFSNIIVKNKKTINNNISDIKTITWNKFVDSILPNAIKIEFYVVQRGIYGGILTSVYDSPPIILWDFKDNRNPFSWYIISHSDPNKSPGSPSTLWNLYNSLVDVVGISMNPTKWTINKYEFPYMNESAFLLLHRCKDLTPPYSSHLSLFPEILKAELKEVRSTIEAYCNHKKPENANYDNLACGIYLQKGNPLNYKVKVTTSNGYIMNYLIDRWE